MEPNCITCFNKPICKLYESTDELQSQFSDAVIVIKECPYHRLANNNRAKAPIKTNKNSNYKDTLSSLGLGEKENHKIMDQTEPILNGDLCPSCNKILGPEKFAGDTCDNCGHHICIDCAYHVNDSILCEECF